MPDSPHSPHDIAALKAALPGLALIEDRALVRRRSRDFFWFSPILDRQLRTKSADIVAQPRIFRDRDQGLDFYGSAVTTTRTVLRERPEAARATIAAMIGSMVWANRNPDGAITICARGKR